jgi:hypothetical protein
MVFYKIRLRHAHRFRGDRRHSLIEVPWRRPRRGSLFDKKARVSPCRSRARGEITPAPGCLYKFAGRSAGQASTMILPQVHLRKPEGGERGFNPMAAKPCSPSRPHQLLPMRSTGVSLTSTTKHVGSTAMAPTKARKPEGKGGGGGGFNPMEAKPCCPSSPINSCPCIAQACC